MAIFIIFYGKLYAKTPPMDSACIPVVTIIANQNNVCSGTTITYQASVMYEGTNGVYKWKKNNASEGANTGANYTSASFTDNDVVICEYSCKTACGVDTTVVSNSVVVHVVNDIIPEITVSNYDSLICEGELTVFTTTSYYGDAIPLYEWTANDRPVGTNSPTFTTSSITNGSKIECKLTITTPSCPGWSKSSTSQLTIYVYPMIHPAITILASKTETCRGETINFTATANGGAVPAFTWKINGIPTGADAPIYSSSTLKDGDTVSCMVTIDQDSRCHTSTSAPSNGVVIHVRDYVDPTLTISAPTLDVCAGTAITFTATPQNAAEYKFYQWRVNGVDKESNSPVFSNNEFADGDSVTCILTTNIPGCPFAASVSSLPKIVVIRDTPVITFTPPQISVMAGDAAQVNASVTGSVAAILWKPDGILVMPHSLTSATVPLMQDIILNLNVVDTNGCEANKELPIKVLHKLYVPSSFTPNQDGKNDLFRIPPGSSLSLTDFIIFDRWGAVIFRTTDINEGWDGTYKGGILQTGAYIYLITGLVDNKKITVKGTVALLR